MDNISIKCLKSETIESGSCHGQFLINSLKPGQGITIGNQLRRVLLNDLGGVAISAVRIAGVSHEFSTIPGVREDILEILLNMKGIVFKSKTKTPQFGRLTIQGPTVVTADLIQFFRNLDARHVKVLGVADFSYKDRLVRVKSADGARLGSLG